MPITGRPLVPNALCMPDDVKIAMGNLGISDARDEVLRSYINLFSTMIEGGAYCDRETLITEREEIFDGIRLGYNNNTFSVNRLFLRAYPIDLTQEFLLYDDSEREWGDETLLELWEDYTVDPRSGIVSFYATNWSQELHSLKAIWTGGLVKDVETDYPVCPEDLRNACALQCAHWIKISNDPGAIQVSASGGGQITLFTPTEILPAVKRVLLSYRRIVF